jgi:hypothetical protein
MRRIGLVVTIVGGFMQPMCALGAPVVVGDPLRGLMLPTAYEASIDVSTDKQDIFDMSRVHGLWQRPITRSKTVNFDAQPATGSFSGLFAEIAPTEPAFSFGDAVHKVPLPAALPMLLVGLGSFASLRKRRNRRSW